MTEVCGVGSLFEDLTGTPAEGFLAGPVLLAPPVVTEFDLDEVVSEFPVDEIVVETAIVEEIYIEAWIGTEGTEIGDPEEPEEPDEDDLTGTLELEDGSGALELEDESGYIELESA